MLEKEDYEEPRCVICDPNTGRPKGTNAIPLDRIIARLDEYTGRQDYEGAERHLKYWMEDAKFNGDLRGQFSLHNEMMGFYRKQGRKDDALDHVREALKLLSELGLDGTVSAGTCYVNCGTVYDNFGMPREALADFEMAQPIYEKNLESTDPKLGGLYNNMALALVDLRRFGEAYRFYQRALEVMKTAPNGKLEMAITYLNMADAVTLEHGIEKASEKIDQYMVLARECMNDENLPPNGYYAYVCEKCAPGFEYYGYVKFAEELGRRAANIYEENRK